MWDTGIMLASMPPNCSVLLTDLPEVEDIITRNINAAQLATMSGVHYQNLDWDDPLDDLCPRPIELILVSESTYNADSLPALVSPSTDWFGHPRRQSFWSL
ncbi:unnamed protein product [Penicillium egyptiacum]|uniref:Uncharacterized protein n=1 Tax=Penicillium egyptiacum TaxID=1303716 RepID=A0A9W4KJE0_9EURO|nr:unnamed protein product [Penicillium egyptiacum]